RVAGANAFQPDLAFPTACHADGRPDHQCPQPGLFHGGERQLLPFPAGRVSPYGARSVTQHGRDAFFRVAQRSPAGHASVGADRRRLAVAAGLVHRPDEYLPTGIYRLAGALAKRPAQTAGACCAGLVAGRRR
nr:hypothetical protein [Tanacetum cinerariifolium]